MAQIHMLPDDIRMDVKSDETILDASLRSGISHAHACGGNAICSTCRVVLLEGEENVQVRNSEEAHLADKLKFTNDVRLACQTKIVGDIKLNRPVLDSIDEELASQSMSNGEISRIGEERTVALLFADIASYTPFAEALPAYDVIHVLNRYFYLMGNIIVDHHGHIIDYYGDGIFAVFGIDERENPALDAVKAGDEMFMALKRLNPYLEKMYNRGFDIRIGIHYGEVIAGSIGINENKKFAVIGDAVNFASRIESANKEHGTNFLISQCTYEEVEEQVIAGKSVEANLKGKSGSYKLFEIKGVK